MVRIFSLAVVLLLAACASPESADETPGQEETAVQVAPDPSNPTGNPEGEIPPGWTIRYDRPADYVVSNNPDSADVWFVTMTPGWHITTRPAGIFYHPAQMASGAFHAETKIHLFPPGERNEGYGMFLGGNDLDGPEQSYVYFLLRRSGEFLVKRRTGDETETLIDWTPSEAVVPFDESTEGTAANVLAVDADDATVRFSVNGEEVGALPREGLPVDGVVGLRLNHAVNVHVEDLSVRLAG